MQITAAEPFYLPEKIIMLTAMRLKFLLGLRCWTENIAIPISNQVEPIIIRQHVEKVAITHTVAEAIFIPTKPGSYRGSDHTGPAPHYKAIQNAHINFIQLLVQRSIARLKP